MTVRDQTARNREQFDQLAGAYDVGQAQRLDRARLARLVGLHAGGRVLDVACGTGAASHALSDDAAALTGLDASPEMLARATRRLVGHAFTPVVGSADALPFADDSFDVALCSRALHHMADPAAVVREMARVVCGGGALVLVENALDEPLAARERFDELERLRDPSHARILATDELRAMLQLCGAAIEQEEATVQLRPIQEWLADAGTDAERARAICVGVDQLRENPVLCDAAQRRFVTGPDGAITICSHLAWLRARV